MKVLPEYMWENPCYTEVFNFYYGLTTKRTKVPLINHIDEGLFVLHSINASKQCMSAYCLHPIVQADKNLTELVKRPLTSDIEPIEWILAMEYRNIANAYLSTRVIDKIEDIKLSVLEEVNQMLIADKIQNRKDFEKYHRNHKRAKELSEYFNNWFMRLNISEETYREFVDRIEQVK